MMIVIFVKDRGQYENKRKKMIEEPVLEINVKVDQSEIVFQDGQKGEKYLNRLNWSNMNSIDLEDIFSTPINNEKSNLEFHKKALIKCKMFKKRLKQYILDKCDSHYQLCHFDWSEWEMTNS